MPLITKYFKGKSFKKKRRAMVEAVNDAYTSTARAVVPKKLQYEFGVDDDTVALTKDKRDHETEVEQKQEDFEAAIAQADREPDPAEVERFLKSYDSTFDDFNEMAIQYGYVALFAPAYPLAPILSAINNVIEIRVDAMKLCYTCQRPLWTQAADIGSWFAVCRCWRIC